MPQPIGRRLADEERALHIDPESAVPIGFGVVGKRHAGVGGDARAVDDNVDARVRCTGLRHCLDHAGFEGDVAAEGACSAAAGRNGCRLACGRRRVPVEQRDRGTLGGKHVGDGAADPGAGAGHDGGTPVEAHPRGERRRSGGSGQGRSGHLHVP